MNLTEPARDASAEAAPGYAVGYGRPPAGRPFSRGVSGNPMGRPRRPAMAQPVPRRLIPAEPTELELALAQRVLCLAADPVEPVSLARAVVSRLTERALDLGDVMACRELLRLVAEAEAVSAERELLAAEQEAAQRLAEEAAEREAEARARDARAQAMDDAREALERMAERAAEDAGEANLADDDRALKLLDAAEFESAGSEDAEMTAIKPWVVEAAQAHDPALPRAGDIRPLDLTDPFDALSRLDVLRRDEDGENGLAGWFIDAGRARLQGSGRPRTRPAPGDEALLARVRVEDGEDEADWVERLEAVERACRGLDRSAQRGVPVPD